MQVACIKKIESVSNLDESLLSGDLKGATTWLSENVQIHGSLFEPKATIEKATGTSVTVDPLLNYLEKNMQIFTGYIKFKNLRLNPVLEISIHGP